MSAAPGAVQESRTRWHKAEYAAIAVVLVACVILRFLARSDLWFDEALSVNISRLEFGEILDALRRDGHPPLYYFVLHGWMEVVGSGDFAVRALSGLFSLATIPVAWVAGRRLGGPRSAVATMLVVAASPYAFRYATEARMYSLVMLLVLLGYVALRRALEQPRPIRLVTVALLGSALVLTQYWNLYLLGTVLAGLAWYAIRGRTPTARSAARRVMGALAIGCSSFVVWLPVFLDQVRHTGTPWGDPQFPWVVLARALFSFGGMEEDGEAYVLLVAIIVLPLLALFGRGLDDRRVELDLHTRAEARWETIGAFGTLIAGAVLSYAAGTTFEPRYAATVFPLVALLVGHGATVFRSRSVFVGVLAFVVGLGIIGGVRNTTDQRTQAEQIARVIRDEARSGDVVVYCPDQLGPAVSRLLGTVPGVEQLTFPDGDRPELVNWSDYLQRINGRDPGEFVSEARARAGDHRIWYVYTQINQVERACGAVGAALDADGAGAVRVVDRKSVV